VNRTCESCIYSASTSASERGPELCRQFLVPVSCDPLVVVLPLLTLLKLKYPLLTLLKQKYPSMTSTCARVSEHIHRTRWLNCECTIRNPSVLQLEICCTIGPATDPSVFLPSRSFNVLPHASILGSWATIQKRQNDHECPHPKQVPTET
jgi:hypothetical protein